MDDLELKTKVSKKVVNLEACMLEEYGLEEYLKKERELIKKFKTSTNNILIFGGVDGIGKTEILGKQTEKTDSTNQLYYYTDSNTKFNEEKELFILDEAMNFDQSENFTGMYKNIENQIKMNKKFILFGGGGSFSPTEQCDYVKKQIRAGVSSAKIETHSIPLIPLNIKQSRELLYKNTKEVELKSLSKEDLFKDERIDAIITALPLEFRIPRVILMNKIKLWSIIDTDLRFFASFTNVYTSELMNYNSQAFKSRFRKALLPFSTQK